MRASLVSCLVLVLACGGDDAASPDGGGGGGSDASVASDAPTGCMRTTAAADRPRFVVISHPYDAAGERAPVFEVLELSAAGALTRVQPPRLFSLAKRASFGTVEFTPDGQVGIVALEDGSLGVFRLDAAGMPTVVHAGLTGSYYATKVVIDPRGDRAWILEGNTRGNGGGIYLVTIACDGTLTDHGLFAAADLPGALAFTNDGRAIVGARDVLDANTEGNDIQLVRWTEPPTAVAGVDVFGADESVGGAALTADGATFLVGDRSGFGAAPNSVAVVGVGASSLSKVGVITPLEDPNAIATSPFGDVAIVTSAFGDHIFVLDKGGTNGAWRSRGTVPYLNGVRPMLPGDLATVSRGMLQGHVFVSENVSVRHLAFRASGMVEDLGSLQLGSGLDNISGVIGVTP
ncbi:MAG: hypothetical protein JWP01_1789 [Myxococcales bacterium]|nr:hypothetical protein [Myxococcales bacterium]